MSNINFSIPITGSGGGGSGTPGGLNTYVQFNDGGIFGGNSNFVYDKNLNVLTVGWITSSNLSQGSVVFAGTGGLLTGSQDHFFYDASTRRIGIGTSTSLTSLLDISGSSSTTIPLRLRAFGANPGSLTTVSSAVGYAFTRFTNSSSTSFDVGVGGVGVSVTAAQNRWYIYNSTFGNTIVTAGTDGNFLAYGNVGIGATLLGSNRLVVGGTSAFSGSVEPGTDLLHDLGSGTKRWGRVFSSAFSGSLTRLIDGSSYLIAGPNITINTGSNGSVQISGSVGLTGTGTTNYIPKFSSPTTLGDSILQEGNGINYVGSNSTFLTSSGFGITFTNAQIWNFPNNTFALDINGKFKFDTANGYLGIGTPSSPAQKIHVAINNGSTSSPIVNDSTSIIRFQNFDTTSNNSTSIINADGNGGDINSYIQFINVDHFTNKGALAFGTRDGASSGTRMRIDEAGNVGIGSITPVSIGTDVFLFVSGSSGSLGTGTRGVAAFGGDVRISGSLLVGTGSIRITSNDIQFGGFSTRIQQTGNNISLFANAIEPGSDNEITLGSPTKRWRQVYVSNVSGSFTGSNLTSGQIVVTGEGGLISGSNALWWDNQNRRVGIGTSSPFSALTVSGATWSDQLSSNVLYVTDVYTTRLSGSLTKLNDGSSYIIGSGSVAIVSQSNGSIKIYVPSQLPQTGFNDGDIAFANSSGLLTGSSLLTWNDSTKRLGIGTLYPGHPLSVFGTTSTTTLLATGISGSLTKLQDGSSYLIASGSISITSGANGSITIFAPNSQSGFRSTDIAFANASGVLTGSSRLTWDNASPNALLSVTGTASATRLSGSLTKLQDGTSYLVAGTNIQIVSSSNGSVTVSGTSTINTNLVEDSVVFVGPGGTLTGSSNSFSFYPPFNAVGINTALPNYALDVKGSVGVSGVVWGNMFVGSFFQSQNIISQAITGSHTELNDGSAYIRGSGNIIVSTGSNGAITISSTGGGGGYWSEASLNTIYSSGSVGIGTSTYSARLYVSGSSTASTPTMIVREGVVSPTDGAAAFNVQNSSGTSLLFVSGSGAVGIGTTVSQVPSHKLHVGGRIGGGSYSGSYLEFLNTGNTVLRANDDLLLGFLQNVYVKQDGSVGIGTSVTNGNKVAISGGNLSVSGSILPSPDVGVDLGSPVYRWRNLYAANISGSLTGSNVTAGQVIVAGTGGVLSGSNNFVWDNANRRVGIGATSPTALLSLRDSSPTILITDSGLGTPSITFAPVDGAIGTRASLSVNFLTAEARLTAGASGGSYFTTFYTNGSERVRISSVGNMAIGGTNPTSRLEVTGSTGDSSAATLHLVNLSGASILYARNDQAVGVGTSTLTAGKSITTAADIDVYGVFIGRGSGGDIDSTVVGNGSLINQTVGSRFNTAVGRSALGSNTSGIQNTAVGRSALTSNQTGNNNVAFGMNAARFFGVATDALTTTTDSIFIGADTRAAADSQTNQIVIGKSAIGLGSNTTVLGNSSTTLTYLAGNVGIGTTVVSSRLIVSGSSSASTPTMIVREGVVSPTGGVGAFDVQNSAGTSILFITGSGNVGIGTNSPTSYSGYTILNIGNSSATGLLKLRSSYNSGNGAEFYQAGTGLVIFSANNSSGAGWYFNPTTKLFDITFNAVSNYKLVTAGLVSSGTIEPSFDVTHDLGTPTKRWRNLYVANISGSLTGSGLEANSIIFVGSGGVLTGSVGLFSYNPTSGNVAIGKNVAMYKLDVGGSINASSDIYTNGTFWGLNASITSTLTAPAISGSLTKLADGSSYLIAGANINITSGSNGSVTVATSGLVGGSGTTNYVPRWNSSSTLTNSIIYDTGTYVGISTNAPASTLQLGDVTVIGQDINSGYYGANFSASGVNRIKAQYAVQTMYDSAAGRITFKRAPAGTAGSAITWTTSLGIDASGNVGIGVSGNYPTIVSRFEVTGSGASSSTSTAHFINTSGASLGFIRDDGAIGFGTTTVGAAVITAQSTSALWAGLTMKNSAGTIGGYIGLDAVGSGGGSTNLSVIGIGTLTLGSGNASKAQLDSTGNFLPTSTNSYDLGSLSLRWKDVYARSGSFTGDITISGNLTVNGTQTIVNSDVVNIKDNAILVNAGPSPLSTGGIYVADTVANITGSLVWDTTTDQWKAGRLGSEVTLVSGSGTTNYLTKWTGANGVGSSIAYDNGSNVGVGTDNPLGKLHVYGSSETLYLEGASNYTTLKHYYGGAFKAELVWFNTTNTYYLRNSISNGVFSYLRGTNVDLQIDGSGNVGIGTTTYTSRLFVSGSSTATTPTATIREGVVSPLGGAKTLDVQSSNGTTLFYVSGSGELGLGSVSSIMTSTTTTTSISPATLMSISSNIFRAAEFTLQGVDTTGAKYHTAKINAVHNGTSTSHVEYGAINVGGIAGTFDVTDPSGGTFSLQVTPSSTNSTVWKVTAILTKA